MVRERNKREETKVEEEKPKEWGLGMRERT